MAGPPGGLVLRLYESSLALLLFVLFAMSVALHAAGGAREYSQEQVAHGEAAVSTWAYLRTSRFWFESFQNWQSEFLAVAVIVGASVYLRQRGSAESKRWQSRTTRRVPSATRRPRQAGPSCALQGRGSTPWYWRTNSSTVHRRSA